MLVRFGNELIFKGEEKFVPFSELQLGAHVPLQFNSPLPSENIWKKFDLSDVPMPDNWITMEDEDEFDPVEDDSVEDDPVEDEPTSAPTVSSPFWPNLVLSCKHAIEIRHHDCMWSGYCRNQEHHRTLAKTANNTKPPCFEKQEVSAAVRTASPPSKRMRTAAPSNCSSASLSANNSVVKSNNSRSLLLTSRTNLNNTRVEQSPTLNRYQRPLESDGDSPRPETPQSLSESEEENDDIPRFRHSLGVVIRSSVAVCDSTPADFFSAPIIKREPKIEVKEEEVDDDEDSSLAVSVSEVTGQVCRPITKTEEVHIKAEPQDSFYSDHSYHLSKGSVKMENLGVQTPSDSEEEIDVVSVGDKQSGGRLPTNPSARDRHQLQQTVASAIRQHQQPNSIPMRITIGDQTVSVRTIPTDSLVMTDKKRKFKGSSGKSNKRPKYQYNHRLPHHKTSRRGSSRGTSDSEPDTCEKRSLHNNMERQRRIDLRNLVEGLRVLVPDVVDKKRVAKVVVLNEAAAYCHSLGHDSKYLLGQLSDLRRKQARLRSQLSRLRREFAANR